jgi:hypothetical protein
MNFFLNVIPGSEPNSEILFEASKGWSASTRETFQTFEIV